MALNMLKRLLGVEDIDFDTSGTGSTNNFTTSTGIVRTLRRLNASHIPLLAATRALFTSATSVDAGMVELNTKINAFSLAVTLTVDTTITIPVDALADEIQILIDAQPKNLGGFTLTFLFPEAINQALINTLSWRNFSNGTLVIEGNSITVADAADVGSLFCFPDCSCKVVIQNFTFQHTHSLYAIKAERCKAIYPTTCNFIGVSGTTYAMYYILSDGITAADCTFADEMELKLEGDVEENRASRDLDNLTDAGKAAIMSYGIPVGITLPFAGAGDIPAGFLLCNGAAVSRMTYANLYSAIGTTYGAGDGSTTFNLPDFRGRFLRGYMSGTSAEIGTAQEDAIRNITGNISDVPYQMLGHGSGAIAKRVGTQGIAQPSFTATNGGGFDFDASLVVPTADENRPANYAVQYIIKY